MAIDKREFEASFKMFETEGGFGRFKGVAAVFSNIDRQGDIIRPGAFALTLGEFIKNGFLANAHDWSNPVGTIETAIETEAGLEVEGEFHSTPSAQLVRQVTRERLARGKSVGMSIGFGVTDFEFEEKTGIRVIKAIDLFEVSIVTVPANPRAHLAGIKAAVDEDNEKVFEGRRVEMRRLILLNLKGSKDYVFHGDR